MGKSSRDKEHNHFLSLSCSTDPVSHLSAQHVDRTDKLSLPSGPWLPPSPRAVLPAGSKGRVRSGISETGGVGFPLFSSDQDREV